MKKKLLFGIILSFISFLLAACGIQTENNKKEAKVPDVRITQSNNTYYAQDSDGNLHANSDAIFVLSYHNYQCTDTNIKYDDENDVYICTVEFKKIIHERENYNK